jgi:hypothetical protein
LISQALSRCSATIPARLGTSRVMPSLAQRSTMNTRRHASSTPAACARPGLTLAKVGVISYSRARVKHISGPALETGCSRLRAPLTARAIDPEPSPTGGHVGSFLARTDDPSLSRSTRRRCYSRQASGVTEACPARTSARIGTGRRRETRSPERGRAGPTDPRRGRRAQPRHPGSDVAREAVRHTLVEARYTLGDRHRRGTRDRGARRAARLIELRRASARGR